MYPLVCVLRALLQRGCKPNPKKHMDKNSLMMSLATSAALIKDAHAETSSTRKEWRKTLKTVRAARKAALDVHRQYNRKVARAGVANVADGVIGLFHNSGGRKAAIVERTMTVAGHSPDFDRIRAAARALGEAAEAAVVETAGAVPPEALAKEIAAEAATIAAETAALAPA